jgi:hypothetical protein
MAKGINSAFAEGYDVDEHFRISKSKRKFPQ